MWSSDTSSANRSPLEYSNSTIAWSRHASSDSPAGFAANVTAWSADNALGKRLTRFGPRTPTTGLPGTSPRSHNHRYIERHADRVRAIEAADRPPHAASLRSGECRARLAPRSIARRRIRSTDPDPTDTRLTWREARRCVESSSKKASTNAPAIEVATRSGAQARQCRAGQFTDSLEKRGSHRRVKAVGSAEPSTSMPNVSGLAPTRKGSKATLLTTPSGPSQEAASKPTFDPQNGMRMLLANVMVSLSTASAQSRVSSAGFGFHRRSAACGTSKMRFSSMINVAGSAASSVSVNSERTQPMSFSAMASFSWPCRTISAILPSSALTRSRSISDWRSTSEIAWPSCG